MESTEPEEVEESETEEVDEHDPQQTENVDQEAVMKRTSIRTKKALNKVN